MDEISTGVLFSLLILMIVLSAYFSSSETGMMALNRYKLRHMANQGHKGAKRVEKLLSRTDRLIGLILIGNNLVNILASAIATILGMRLYGDAGVAIATGALTILILVFAEVTPKTVAALYPERVSYASSIILNILMKVLYPLVWFVNGITSAFLFILGLKSSNNSSSKLSSEELRTVVNEAGGLIPRRHQDMLLSILDLENVTVEDLMVPRSEIAAINVNDDWKSIVRQLSHSAHGRIVLYRDNIDEVVGMLRVREAYRLMMDKNDFSKENLLRAADEVYFIPEGTPLNTQLLKFQRNKERIGLIVDEYGDIQGLITVEDILEEIVGEFTTSITPTLAEEITAQSDGSLMIEGSANIRDLNKSLNWKLPTDGPRTLNGLILEHLEYIPENQVSIIIADHKMEIVEVSDNMIKLIKVLPDNP
ncbi:MULTISPECIES: HlyC/CorC family transporter [unclassified Photobacterium]|uniref:HlyC/CorC family transporter n=1 Tax=unclassified Photobacterium TaxID=2628852 RepID=UPI000D15C4F5|nr:MULTISPECIES: CNNM domain-containing protein [unclassified Photobacterium]PSV22350.1 magnesium/cobalt efflux protein [Photobacterium sp. GB-56]PSV26738.1 magnesium/cobalt efflux protein [Photobacterium sp. GB-72]PSV31602.1 magnesium/cobalt efflux protein [Photobacterium sp. GB-27]PSV32792.1 magnesium/cobalt efflux protein [Photobacterium sp. GB-210]PSV40324.1 magnesium/cobalt efflux protein [Photobacterium sp. GB-36]